MRISRQYVLCISIHIMLILKIQYIFFCAGEHQALHPEQFYHVRGAGGQTQRGHRLRHPPHLQPGHLMSRTRTQLQVQFTSTATVHINSYSYSTHQQLQVQYTSTATATVHINSNSFSTHQQLQDSTQLHVQYTLTATGPVQ